MRVISGSILAGLVGWAAAPVITGERAGSSAGVGSIASTEQSIHFRGCNEARAAGAAPIRRGQPGYREGMDGDGDGVACEDYSGW